MRVLANLLPGLVGLFVGVVALVSAHVETARLKLRQQTRRNTAITEPDAD